MSVRTPVDYEFADPIFRVEFPFRIHSEPGFSSLDACSQGLERYSDADQPMLFRVDAEKVSVLTSEADDRFACISVWTTSSPGTAFRTVSA